jgi:hypothetical protein
MPRSSVFLVLAGSFSIAHAQTPDQPTPPPQAPDPNWAPPPAGEDPNAPKDAPKPLPPGPETKPAANGEKKKSMTLDIYGFAMLDAGIDFGKIGDPNWQDTLRPTKLPAFEDQFGDGPRSFWGVRQSRFGVKAVIPTDFKGDIETKFEFELFGTGPDEGQTTFRLRHAYGDWWQLRAGQTWSPFMDIDVFPNSVEYWGPNGMVFFRNVQLAWMPVRGDSRVTVALERPGAAADGGLYADRVELEGVVPRFPVPDLSAEARYGQKWGYVELAGILRWINWDDLNGDPLDLSGSELGWGVNLSSNIKLAKHVVRLQAVYGEGIQNYMNDAGSDVAPEMTGDPAMPIDGAAIPVFGALAFIDLNWSKQFTSTVGYSFVWVDNTDGQTPESFHMGHYALGNILYHPVEQLFIGPEFQFGRRENNSDGFDANDFRLQVSVKYTFSHTLGGN